MSQRVRERKPTKVRWEKIADARRKHIDAMTRETYKLLDQLIAVSARLAELARDMDKGCP